MTKREVLLIICTVMAGCGPGSLLADADDFGFADVETETEGAGDGEPSASCNDEKNDCEAGDCADGLVCTLGEICDPCPVGTPGCPCGRDSFCEVGECTEGSDDDGSTWSICYIADLIPCLGRPCPGDAHCTDDYRCAWLD